MQKVTFTQKVIKISWKYQEIIADNERNKRQNKAKKQYLS